MNVDAALSSRADAPAEERVNLTVRRVEEIQPPSRGERRIYDTKCPGLALRLRASGGKSWQFTYRTGGGRGGRVRRMTLGAFPAVGLAEARREADRLRGLVATGRDPVADEREALAAAAAEAEREAAAARRLRLSEALDLYAAHLERRGVRDRRNVLSALRRRLLGIGRTGQDGGLGDVPLETMTRGDIMAVVSVVEAGGERGAARSLRQKTTTFLNWAVEEGHIATNPLAGIRRRRATRAEQLERPGRMLTVTELAAIWRASLTLEQQGGTGARALSAIVRLLILTGQRRTETARMRHQDLDEGLSWWIIPPAEAKNGLAHSVPLAPEAAAIIKGQPRHAECPWVFTSDGRNPVSGWSKLLPRLRAIAETEGVSEPWTLHDLRRSFRSGLTRLRVDTDLAEIMINHRPERLRSIYDREPRLDERREAALDWARHLAEALGRSM